MDDLVTQVRKHVRKLQKDITTAKNKGEPLHTLIEMNRNVDAAKDFRHKVMRHQFDLENAGIVTLEGAGRWLRSRGLANAWAEGYTLGWDDGRDGVDPDRIDNPYTH